MAGIFALLPDIIPMIVPAAVQITKEENLKTQREGNDSPMIRQGAVIGKSDKMCATGKAVLASNIAGKHYDSPQAVSRPDDPQVNATSTYHSSLHPSSCLIACLMYS